MDRQSHQRRRGTARVLDLGSLARGSPARRGEYGFAAGGSHASAPGLDASAPGLDASPLRGAAAIHARTDAEGPRAWSGRSLGAGACKRADFGPWAAVRRGRRGARADHTRPSRTDPEPARRLPRHAATRISAGSHRGAQRGEARDRGERSKKDHLRDSYPGPSRRLAARKSPPCTSPGQRDRNARRGDGQRQDRGRDGAQNDRSARSDRARRGPP